MSGADQTTGGTAPSGAPITLIPIRAAMARLGVGRTTIYKLAGLGRLHLVHPAGVRKVCITSTSLEACLAASVEVQP